MSSCLRLIPSLALLAAVGCQSPSAPAPQTSPTEASAPAAVPVDSAPAAGSGSTPTDSASAPGSGSAPAMGSVTDCEFVRSAARSPYLRLATGGVSPTAQELNDRFAATRGTPDRVNLWKELRSSGMLAAPLADSLLPLLSSNEVSERFEAAMTLPVLAPDAAVQWATPFAVAPNASPDQRQTASLVLAASGEAGLRVLGDAGPDAPEALLMHVEAGVEFPEAAVGYLLTEGRPCASLQTRTCRSLARSLALVYPDLVSTRAESLLPASSQWQLLALELKPVLSADETGLWAGFMGSMDDARLAESLEQLGASLDFSAAAPVMAGRLASPDLDSGPRRRILQSLAFQYWRHDGALEALAQLDSSSWSEQDRSLLAFAMLAHGATHERVMFARDLITWATSGNRDPQQLAALVLWELDLGRDRIEAAWAISESWQASVAVLNAPAAADAITAAAVPSGSTWGVLDALTLRAGRSSSERTALAAAVPPPTPQTFWGRVAVRLGPTDTALAERLAGASTMELDLQVAAWLQSNGQMRRVEQWVQTAQSDPSPWVRDDALAMAAHLGLAVDSAQLWQTIVSGGSTRFLDSPTLRLRAAQLCVQTTCYGDLATLRTALEQSAPTSPAAQALAALAAAVGSTCQTADDGSGT